MAEGRVFGRRADGAPEQEDAPIPFSVIGYARWDIVDEDDKVLFKKDAELKFEFSARGSAPLGSMIDLSAQVTEEKEVQALYFLRLLRQCLFDPEERRRFSETIDRSDVKFTTEMFAEIIDYLYEEWTGRPFRSRSERRSGSSRTATGSRANSRARASGASRK